MNWLEAVKKEALASVRSQSPEKVALPGKHLPRKYEGLEFVSSALTEKSGEVVHTSLIPALRMWILVDSWGSLSTQSSESIKLQIDWEVVCHKIR